MFESIEDLDIEEYDTLEWAGYELVSLKPNDLFHSICRAFYKPYIYEEYEGNKISRVQIVNNLRKELADKLISCISGTKVRYYDTLRGGDMIRYTKDHPEYNFMNMYSTLNSNKPVSTGYLEFIGNQINKDILIVTSEKTLLKLDEYKWSIKKRPTIILLFVQNEYRVVGVKEFGKIRTHLPPIHPFVVHLREPVGATN